MQHIHADWQSWLSPGCLLASCTSRTRIFSFSSRSISIKCYASTEMNVTVQLRSSFLVSWETHIYTNLIHFVSHAEGETNWRTSARSFGTPCSCLDSSTCWIKREPAHWGLEPLTLESSRWASWFRNRGSHSHVTCISLPPLASSVRMLGESFLKWSTSRTESRGLCDITFLYVKPVVLGDGTGKRF